MGESKQLARPQITDLAQAGNLIERGLTLARSCLETDAIVPEEHVRSFLSKLSEVENTIGGLPEEFQKGKTQNPHDVLAFDINRYLKAYDLVGMHKDYVLDYVYAFDGHGGEPFVYARKADAAPIATLQSYLSTFHLPKVTMLLGDEAKPNDSRPYLDHLEFDYSVTGCFQFALFCLMIRRFYLHWHSNYNSRRFFLTRDRIDPQANMESTLSDEEKKRLAAWDVRPRVSFEDSVAKVKLACYKLNYGYSDCYVCVRWPNVVDDVYDDILVPSHRHIMF